MKVRKLLILVLVVGVVFWVGLVAFRTVNDSQIRFHFHGRPGVRIWADVRTKDDLGPFHVTRFWPSFQARLLGRPWPGDYVCPDAQAPYQGPILPPSPPGLD